MFELLLLQTQGYSVNQMARITGYPIRRVKRYLTEASAEVAGAVRVVRRQSAGPRVSHRISRVSFEQVASRIDQYASRI